MFADVDTIGRKPYATENTEVHAALASPSGRFKESMPLETRNEY